jgi:hypothetical protein
VHIVQGESMNGAKFYVWAISHQSHSLDMYSVTVPLKVLESNSVRDAFLYVYHNLPYIYHRNYGY